MGNKAYYNGFWGKSRGYAILFTKTGTFFKEIAVFNLGHLNGYYEDYS